MAADRSPPRIGAVPLRAPVTEPLDGAMRERLLEAADRVVRKIGMNKTSMADVARNAGVARGTLYRYFESRESLFDALTQRTGARFFEKAAKAMDQHEALAEQLQEFSEIMIRAIHPEAGEWPDNQETMVHLLSTQSRRALRTTATFLRPYIERARVRGEVRKDLDVADAGEWLARILLSFTIFQASISYEADDPGSVGLFIQRYAINGLTAG